MSLVVRRQYQLINRHLLCHTDMKNIAFILILVAATSFFGCSKASSSRHLTQTQVLDIAKPRLQLRPGESYHMSFTNGTWKIWNSDDGTIKGGRGGSTVLEIRDSDGQILNTTTEML